MHDIEQHSVGPQRLVSCMKPEEDTAHDRGDHTRRNRLVGLACIAHELLTGRHPFDRVVANDARDSGLKLVRRNSMSAAQFRAIAHGLEFDREKRTPGVQSFM